MTTLFDILLQTARALEALQEGTASATSANGSTLVDSQLVVRGFTADDFFNGGTLLFQSTTEAQRVSRLVADYAGATGLITLAVQLGVTPAAGARYGVMTRRYPREVMSAKINEALVELGDVPTVDTASLTTASNQLEYNLPVAARRDLRQVWLARQLAAPWEWERQLRVRAEPGTGLGAVGVLLFPDQPQLRAGYKLKLVYLAPHPRVEFDYDLVSDYVSVDWLGLAAAEKLARWRLEGPGADERDLTALLNNLTLRVAQARRRHPVTGAPSFPVLP
jgi:hypothetical protein